jgi:hypothetical protein
MNCSGLSIEELDTAAEYLTHGQYATLLRASERAAGSRVSNFRSG